MKSVLKIILYLLLCKQCSKCSGEKGERGNQVESILEDTSGYWRCLEKITVKNNK